MVDAIRSDGDGQSLVPLPEWPAAARLGAWALFWLLNLLVGLQEYLRHGGQRLWEPFVWEGSSCLVATFIVAWQWQVVKRDDAYLAEPRRWFMRRVVVLLPISLAFVTTVFGLRHGVYAILGLSYQHDTWTSVYLYETTKFAMFFMLFSAVFFGVRSYAAVSRERVAAARAQALARQTQLIQLAQQIEPHFLFNAIGTISETIHSNPALADKLLSRLAGLLRAATDLTRRPDVSLREELQLLEGYASIMRERFSDRIEELAFEVPEELLNCRLPSLLLQPLLENAFKHGVEKELGTARLKVSASALPQDRMQVVIECNLGTLPESVRFGTGITNLRERLATTFGNRANLAVEPRAQGGVQSVVTLPCVR